MNSPLLFWGSCSLWAITAGILAWYCGRMASQITFATLADGRRQERDLPLLFKIVLPLAPNVLHLFQKPSFDRIRTDVDRRLTSGGFQGILSAEEFLSLRILLPLIPGLLWLLLISLAISSSPFPILKKLDFLLYLIGPLYLFIFPDVWLRRTVQARHKSIQRSLPFVLDLLTLSVEAGMDFMTALQRHVEKQILDPFGEELLIVIREIQLGKTRREALRDMSRRVNLSDLRTVVTALVQADELGVSIGAILRIQSDQMRQRRFERAERLANEAPVKMLAPLLLFIFPSVFLVLLGPILVKLIHQGF